MGALKSGRPPAFNRSIMLATPITNVLRPEADPILKRTSGLPLISEK
jgi:hypothetical protein